MPKQISLDLTKAAYTIFGRGIKRDNPKKCLRCGKRIQRADAWETNWSAQDPKMGRYATIKHLGKCPKSRK
jgi:hypothetical protein